MMTVFTTSVFFILILRLNQLDGCADERQCRLSGLLVKVAKKTRSPVTG
jgi:hypothetical protein